MVRTQNKYFQVGDQVQDKMGTLKGRIQAIEYKASGTYATVLRADNEMTRISVLKLRKIKEKRS